MQSNYKRIGNYVEQVKVRNVDNSLTIEHLRGIRINKEFMPSVANVTGTDLSKYKVVEKNQFAYNPMHVGRDEVLPISMLMGNDRIIVSPAYVIFEIVDTSELVPEYLMIWCRRSEFDRNAWFTTDSSVRGGFNWDNFCDLELPVPSIDKQKEIVKEYHTITDRIKLNEQLNQKLEETAQAIYKNWFVDFEFPNANGKPYKSSGGEMVYCAELNNEIPKKWNISTVGNEIDHKKGYAFKSVDYSDKGVGIVRVSNLTENSIDISECYFIDGKKIKEYEQYKLNTNDIIIATVGSWANNPASVVGKVIKVPIVANDFLLNQNTVLLRTKDYRIQEYLYQHLNTKKYSKYVVSGAQGSANQASVTLNHLFEYKFIVPDSISIDKFDSIFDKINKNIHNTIQENYYLLNLKEILLSKMATIEEIK
jgi:type I restriction enzyme S subunit